MNDEIKLRLDGLEKTFGVTVELSVPVPVEFSGRKLPGTGMYKGTPFFGTSTERAKLTCDIAEVLRSNWPTVVSPPQSWYDMDSEEYATTYMEANSSVHISPEHYRAFTNWSK